MKEDVGREDRDGNIGKRPGPGLLRPLLPVLLLVTMIAGALPTPAAYAAQRGQAIPDNVLMASVRIGIEILVTPSRNGDPFLCTGNDGTYLDLGNGSGTIITPDGYVLTNRHVTDALSEIGEMPDYVEDYCAAQARGRATVEFAEIVWLPDERGTPTTPYQAELVKRASRAEDMAILKLTSHLDGSPITESFSYVEFGDSDALREPETIFLIGYPLNAGPSRRVSEGIFSGWGDNGYGVQWIYTDAVISGGNSGGTAVNGDGLFIGIPTQGTSSDCRPGDTNNDGVVDEQDQGCVGIGGNYGILIPSNIARVFAEETLGIDIPVVEGTGTQEPTPIATEEPTPEDTGELIGSIEFSALDANGDLIDGFNNVATLQGCFENFRLEAGDTGAITWLLDGELFVEYDFTWDDAWNPQACGSIWNTDGSLLEPGAYVMIVDVNGESYTSDEVVVTASDDESLVNVALAIEARTTDRDRVALDADGVLAGEFDILYVTVSGTGLSVGSDWQIALYRDGDLIDSSRSKSWSDGDADGVTVRFRPDGTAFLPGDYEAVLVVDDTITTSIEFTIEG